MLRISTENLVLASELINEIVSKANGVFLWVKLVVGSLQRISESRHLRFT